MEKKHRHNGVNMGYEFPHPTRVNEETPLISSEGNNRKSTKVSYSGSKGMYDLQLLSQPNPHIMIIGESGAGKSTTQETLLVRAYGKFGIPFLIINWGKTYTGLDEYVNKWSVPGNLRINPFALRGMKPERRTGVASEVLQIALELTPMQAQRVRDLLAELYKTNPEPTVQDLYDSVMQEIELEKYKEMKLQLRYIAEKLSQAREVFGKEPEEFWSSYDKACGVIELEGLTDAEKTLITLVIVQRSYWIYRYKGKDDDFFLVSDTKKNPKKIRKMYRTRWEIETGFREVNRVNIKTTTRDFMGRLFFYIVSCIIYNLWQRIRFRCNLFVIRLNDFVTT